jgi:hypothetical protein
MQLVEYINNLNEIYNKYGPDLEVVFSIDDEGNEFNKVNFRPSVGIFDEDDRTFMDINADNDNLSEEIDAVCIN